MAKPSVTSFVLGLLLLSTLPLGVLAEDSGGVQAGASTVSLQPSNPTEGASTTVILTLYNSNDFTAYDVLYKFYKDGISAGKLAEANTIDIPAESSIDVEYTWSGLTEGDHKVWIAFDHNEAGEQTFYKSFTVLGLADLEVNTIETSPSEMNSGNQVLVSVLVENRGSVNAPASKLQIDLEDQSISLDVATLDAGSTIWVNQSMTAPESGTHDVTITLDLEDTVIESDETNIFSSSLTVDERMDLMHLGETLVVEVSNEALMGPWIISGIISRTNGNGTIVVPMKLEITDNLEQSVIIPPFEVTISGGETVQKAWSFQLNYSLISNLAPGTYSISAIIDPYHTASFTQESRDNDEISGTFSKLPIPDVSLDPIAIPSVPQVSSGEAIEWTISVTNNGQIPVSGRLVYDWEGLIGSQSQVIIIQPESTYVWQEMLLTTSGSHQATLSAHWIPLVGSWDSDPVNSVAEGTVEVEAQLRLEWQQNSVSVTEMSGNAAEFPLLHSKEYIITVNLSSIETGVVNMSCENGVGEVWGFIEVEVVNRSEIVQVSCTFIASHPKTNLLIISNNSIVTSTFTRNWDTASLPGQGVDSKADGTVGILAIIGIMLSVLVGALVAAIYLTRDPDEEVERDIFDYCPACDGELEGGEDRCPSCSFNLKKARQQFHDCETCTESIPDLLSNCPYCGTQQDVSKYFQRRERKTIETKEEISLPDEEEIDPTTIHASGYEDFDEAVKEFGYDADDLEDHWDESIAKAEAEVEAAYDRRVAAEIDADMDDEEAMAIVEPTLKSIDETFEGHDIDAILASKGEIKPHLDKGDELTASDAAIRGRLYEITGEKGVMPGDEVNIGMGIQDRSLPGNELPEEAMDFSFDDDEDEINPVQAQKRKLASQAQKRKLARRKAKVETAECGACGADIPVDAKGCSTCGAKFE